MTLSEIPIDDLLKRLHLANARRVWRDLAQRAEKEQWSYQEFLAVLVAEEVAHRQGTRLRRLSNYAHFPFLKTIDDFDFTFQSTLRLSMLGSYLSADFVTEGRTLILSGKPGRGKTHLAIAIAYRAIQNGFDARFATCAELVDDLSSASREGRLTEQLAKYTSPDVLVVDEVGYLTYGTDAANVLFHVVNERHLRKRSMVFTTNKSLNAWGRVLHDQDLAEAIVDRILDRGRHLELDGPSVRTHHLGLEASTDATELLSSPKPGPSVEPGGGEPHQTETAPAAAGQVVTFSGITRPYFPEPTHAPSMGGILSATRSFRGACCPMGGILSAVRSFRGACSEHGGHFERHALISRRMLRARTEKGARRARVFRA